MARIFAATACHSPGSGSARNLPAFDALDERTPPFPGEHEDRSLWVLGVTDGPAVRQVGYLHAVAAGSVAVGALAPRGTVWAYLKGNRQPGKRAPRPDTFLPFAGYSRRRFTDDPHLGTRTLFAEVTALGYPGSYQTFCVALQHNQVRQHACRQCRAPRPGLPGSTCSVPPARTTADPSRPDRRGSPRLLPRPARRGQPRHHR